LERQKRMGARSYGADLYLVLGVESAASASDIKTAYRKLAHTFHPDVNRNPGAEDKFKLVVAAYEVLKDPDKRADYDRAQARKEKRLSEKPAPRQRTRPPPTRADPAAEAARHYASAQSTNADIRIKLPITYAESILGISRRVTFRRREPCPLCGGRPTPGKPCRECRDLGYADIVRFHTWDIPPGTETGATERVIGAGDRLPNRTGDLYITLTLEKQVGLDRKGADFYATKRVSANMLKTGGVISIAGPVGAVTLRIEPGTRPGAVIRMPDVGLPYEGGRGSLFVTIESRVA